MLQQSPPEEYPIISEVAAREFVAALSESEACLKPVRHSFGN